MRIRSIAYLGGLVGSLMATTALAQEDRREVAEHVHGESVLRMAVEGSTIMIDFDIPGVDVLGWEHEPASEEDEAQVAAVTSQLEDLLSLISFGDAAGCGIVTAEVELLVEEHDHEHEMEEDDHEHEEGEEHEDEDHEHEEGEEHDHEHEEGEITNHVGFEAVYELACDDVSAIRELSVEGLFDAYPGSNVVELQLATPSGQTSVDIERPETSVDLTGLI